MATRQGSQKTSFWRRFRKGPNCRFPKIWYALRKIGVGHKRFPSTRFPRESLMCNGQQCIDVHINTLSTVSEDSFFSLKLAIACSDRPWNHFGGGQFSGGISTMWCSNNLPCRSLGLHSAKAVLPSLSCAFVNFGPSVCHGDYSWSVENANVVASCSKERGAFCVRFCVGFGFRFVSAVPVAPAFRWRQCVVNLDSVLSRNSLDLKKTVAEYWYFLKPCPEKNTSEHVNGTAHCKIAAHTSWPPGASLVSQNI